MYRIVFSKFHCKKRPWVAIWKVLSLEKSMTSDVFLTMSYSFHPKCVWKKFFCRPDTAKMFFLAS